jgi:hypothetical protein
MINTLLQITFVLAAMIGTPVIAIVIGAFLAKKLQKEDK